MSSVFISALTHPLSAAKWQNVDADYGNGECQLEGAYGKMDDD